MSHAIDERPFPRGVLLAAGALISFTLAAAFAAKLTGVGAVHSPAVDIVESRLLKFEQLDQGRIRVLDAEAGDREIAVVSQNKFGFIGVVVQGLTRERALRHGDPAAAVRLNRRADGRAELQDPVSGHTIPLGAFGPDNLIAFTQLFDNGRTAR